MVVGTATQYEGDGPAISRTLRYVEILQRLKFIIDFTSPYFSMYTIHRADPLSTITVFISFVTSSAIEFRSSSMNTPVLYRASDPYRAKAAKIPSGASVKRIQGSEVLPFSV